MRGCPLGVLVAFLAGACAPDHGNFPPGTPPGPGPIGGGGPDAAPIYNADAAAGPRITGRVCVSNDLRTGAACSTLAGSSLRVTVSETGANTTISAIDGSFSLPSYPADAANATLTLYTSTNDPTYFGGARVVVLPADGNVTVFIPVLTRTDVQALIDTNLTFVAAGDSILVAHFLHSGVPLAGVTVSTAAGKSPYYDAGDRVVYSTQPPTGVAGTVLWFDVPPGTTSFTAQSSTLSVTVSGGVIGGVIQIVDVQF